MAHEGISNKQIVLDFYRDVFNGWDVSKVAEYVSPSYIQHNPTVKDGLEGFEKFIRFFTGLEPHCEIIRCDEVGDIVYVFFRCTLGNGMVNKVMDIYRLEDGMLAEHWDVVEHDVAKAERDAVNENGIW
jgi:predicted SnoaL-like aldol condensation-catalyzing enzyme